MTSNKLLLLGVIPLGFFACPGQILADEPAPAMAGSLAPGGLPPLPPPADVPAPGPMTDAPYAPRPILPGGVVVPLYPPNSAYLDQDQIRKPEKYFMSGPGEIGAIVHINNPSIEFHPGDGPLNTGAAIVLAAGGGHRTLNVGGEGSAEVHYFSNYGVNTIILRNRLRSDGYDPKVDGVNDALQAIKLVRAHAKDWKLDPHKIGFMGFSAGAELAEAATLQWADFDRKNDRPDNPLAKVSSRPDFAALIYPGPSPFANAGTSAIPRDAPPAFFVSAGWGDWIHAVWANEYFTALLNDGVPNVEIHIYARGHHPGDKVGPGEPPSTGGLTDRGFIAYGMWPDRFIDWFRDLGFLNKPGIETQAAKDVAANLSRIRQNPVQIAPTGPGAALVGTWQSSDGKEVLKFGLNGELKSSAGNVVLPGHYECPRYGLVELRFEGSGAPPTSEATYEMEGNLMRFKDSGGQVVEFVKTD
jgi:endo-1,4-beta-xylanase